MEEQKEENEWTHLRVRKNTWSKLLQMKSFPSETFDDIINILLENQQ